MSGSDPGSPAHQTPHRLRPDAAFPKVKLERRQELEQLVREHALDIDLYLELAALHRAEDRPLEARRLLQQALQLSKDDPRVLWEFEEATLARSLQQYREVSDLAARLHTPEVDRELKRSQTDWANRRLEVCRARLARDPSKHSLRLVVAEALYDLGMFKEACEELQPCLEIDTLAPSANLIRGKCLLDMGNDLAALSALRSVALRRAVPAPAKLRVTALRLALEVAQRHHLELSVERYRHALETAEHDLAKDHRPAEQKHAEPDRIRSTVE
ncbi:MAG: tetratricopeptide repeat protein [Planctomycetaceae bacterium]